jgi:hypothetical protein
MQITILLTQILSNRQDNHRVQMRRLFHRIVLQDPRYSKAGCLKNFAGQARADNLVVKFVVPVRANANQYLMLIEQIH